MADPLTLPTGYYAQGGQIYDPNGNVSAHLTGLFYPPQGQGLPPAPLQYPTFGGNEGAVAAGWDSLIAAQAERNRQTEAGTNVEGLVSGRTRYAPVIQGGIFKGVVDEGMAKIADLMSKKNAAVQEAINARDEKNYKAMQDAMDRARQTELDLKKAAQDSFDNALKTKADLRAQNAADATAAKTLLDNSAESVAGTLSTMTDEKAKASYVSNYAKTHGLDPVALTSAVVNYNDTKYKPIDAKIYDIGVQFPGIVTSKDIATHDIAGVLAKIQGSEMYRLKTAKERADLAKSIADAAGGGIVDDSIASQWATTGKPPAKLKPGTLEYSTAYEQAKNWARDNFAPGTIVDSATGFQLPPGRIPAATLQKVGATVATFSLADEMKRFLDTHTTYPGGKQVAGAGKLTKLTPADTEYFMRLRDGLTAQYVQSISGVAVNEAEYKRLSNLIPNTGDWNKYNLAKMDAFLDNMKANTRSNLGITNATIKGVDLQTTFEKKAEINKFKKSLKGGQRLVQDKDGNIVTLDASDPLQPGDIVL